jgi:hypothetical protein
MGPSDDVSDWKVAKREAFRIAKEIGAEIRQSPDGQTKKVLIAGRVQDCATWLAAYSFVSAIAKDRQPKTPRDIPEARIPTVADLVGHRVTVKDGKLAGQTVVVIGPVAGKEGYCEVRTEGGQRWGVRLSRIT